MLPRLLSETTWWNGTEFPTNFRDNGIVALQVVDTFKRHTSHPIFPAAEPLPLGRGKEG